MIFHTYIFIEKPLIAIENQWKIMDFRDFPTILGNSGKYEIHPPKFCAGLVCDTEEEAARRDSCSRSSCAAEVRQASYSYCRSQDVRDQRTLGRQRNRHRRSVREADGVVSRLLQLRKGSVQKVV